jgi:deoxycytidine triphosphate deaminase
VTRWVPNGQGWLTGTKIDQEVSAGRLVIEPYHRDHLNPNSYNYQLSPHLKRITSEIVDCRQDDEYVDITVPEEGFILEPRECYLGATMEVFGSDVYASLVTGRSSIGRKFITNHITAGLIDQGFFGNITLEIVVFKRTRVYPGMKFGQIFWFTTSGDPFLYDGKYQGQRGPTLSRLHADLDLAGGVPAARHNGNSFSVEVRGGPTAAE